MTPKNQIASAKLTTSVVSLAAFFCPISAFAQPEYSITDLGVVGRYSREGAMAVNDRGQVVGGYHGHAFLWAENERTDLGTLPPLGFEDGAASVAYGINNRGVIVGCSGSFSAVFGTGLASERAFVSEESRLQELTGSPGSIIPYAVNDLGQIAGVDAFRGFFYASGKLIELGTLSKVPNGNRSTASGLNAQGIVVGWTTISASHQSKSAPLAVHAFLWKRRAKSGQMRDLGTLPGWVNSYAHGINRQGEIAGSVSDAGSSTNGVYASSHAEAFLWRKSKMVSLGTLPGSKSSEAFGINDSTEIVGASGNRAFLWTQGRMLDLNAALLAGSGWTLEEARAINNKGQIVGQGLFQGKNHAFLLTPIIKR